jgi:hypothetical protein
MLPLSEMIKAALAIDQTVLDAVYFDQFLLFINLCSYLHAKIDLARLETEPLGPPKTLPQPVIQFLVASLSSRGNNVATDIIRVLWRALREIIWSLGPQDAPKSVLHLFLTYGTPLGIGKYMLSQPFVTNELIYFLRFHDNLATHEGM